MWKKHEKRSQLIALVIWKASYVLEEAHYTNKRDDIIKEKTLVTVIFSYSYKKLKKARHPGKISISYKNITIPEKGESIKIYSNQE